MENIVLERNGKTVHTIVLAGNVEKVIGRDVDGINNVIVSGDVDVTASIKRKRHMTISGGDDGGVLKVESMAPFRIWSAEGLHVRTYIGTNDIPSVGYAAASDSIEILPKCLVIKFIKFIKSVVVDGNCDTELPVWKFNEETEEMNFDELMDSSSESLAASDKSLDEMLSSSLESLAASDKSLDEMLSSCESKSISDLSDIADIASSDQTEGNGTVNHYGYKATVDPPSQEFIENILDEDRYRDPELEMFYVYKERMVALLRDVADLSYMAKNVRRSHVAVE